jgi:hypothetical protein
MNDHTRKAFNFSDLLAAIGGITATFMSIGKKITKDFSN